MAKFTPGPWQVNTYTNYAGWSVFGPLEGSAIGGCVAERWYSYNLTKEATTEAHANAHLIAAAPDMYATLEFIKDWFTRLEGGFPDDDPLKSSRERFHAPIHSAIDAALAKADGHE